MKRFGLPIALSAAILGPAWLPAAETPWKAGVARVNITPDQPVPMAGYAARTAPFQRVEHDIFAKALALEDEQGSRAVLITTDLVGIPAAIAEPIRESIQKTTGLARDRILISSSHTHSAPLLAQDEKTRYQNIAAADGRNLVNYTAALQDKIVAAAREALDRLQPAGLVHGTGLAHFAMNRRQFTDRGVIIGVNPRGLVDRSVPVLGVRDPDGKWRAVLFGYACHNTTLTGGNTSLCGDYAGFAQRFIENEHPDGEALFMMGCGGDANPHPRGTMENARDHGAALGREVCRVLEETMTPVAGPLACAFGLAELPLETFARSELEAMAAGGPSWRSGNARQMLDQLDQHGSLPAHYAAPVSVWQFGRDLTLVGLPGEVVVDYVPLIEKAIGPLNLWIAAYCHDVCGYIPSTKTLHEGGYECRGLYTSPGFFAANVETVLIEKVRELAKSAGRELDGR